MDQEEWVRGMVSALWDCPTCGGLSPAAGERGVFVFAGPALQIHFNLRRISSML
jgi:hypothetical protein